jgi:hypothetical protein
MYVVTHLRASILPRVLVIAGLLQTGRWVQRQGDLEGAVSCRFTEADGLIEGVDLAKRACRG